MPNDLVDSDAGVSDFNPVQSSQVALFPEQYSQALAELETGVANLQAAFDELERLKNAETELAAACEQVTQEEKAVLENQDASEKQSVERLLKVRALKDVRAARLATHKKRLANCRDLIQFDLAEPLRKSFANFAHALLIQKEREISELFSQLLPPGSIAGIDNRDLVRASAPVTRFRQIANWTNGAPHKDQEQELAQLQQLPRRWLDALMKLIDNQAEA